MDAEQYVFLEYPSRYTIVFCIFIISVVVFVGTSPGFDTHWYCLTNYVCYVLLAAICLFNVVYRHTRRYFSYVNSGGDNILIDVLVDS